MLRRRYASPGSANRSARWSRRPRSRCGHMMSLVGRDQRARQARGRHGRRRRGARSTSSSCWATWPRMCMRRRIVTFNSSVGGRRGRARASRRSHAVARRASRPFCGPCCASSLREPWSWQTGGATGRRSRARCDYRPRGDLRTSGGRPRRRHVRRVSAAASASALPIARASSSVMAAASGRRLPEMRCRRLGAHRRIRSLSRSDAVEETLRRHRRRRFGFADYLRTFLSLRGYETRAFSRGRRDARRGQGRRPARRRAARRDDAGHERARDAARRSRPPRPTCR